MKIGNQNKRMSLAIRNIDFNAYRAFKYSSEAVNGAESKHKQSTNKKGLYILIINPFIGTLDAFERFKKLKNPHSQMSKRSRWEEIKNFGEIMDLEGKLNKKYNEGLFNYSIKKGRNNNELSKSNSVWESLMNKTQQPTKNEVIRDYSSKISTAKKLFESSNSQRTLFPNKDVS